MSRAPDISRTIWRKEYLGFDAGLSSFLSLRASSNGSPTYSVLEQDKDQGEVFQRQFYRRKRASDKQNKIFGSGLTIRYQQVVPDLTLLSLMSKKNRTCSTKITNRFRACKVAKPCATPHSCK